MVPLLDVTLRGREGLAAAGCVQGRRVAKAQPPARGHGPLRIHSLNRETENSSVGRDLPDTAEVLARGSWQTPGPCHPRPRAGTPEPGAARGGRLRL